MEKLLQTILEPLVDFPEDLQITRSEHASSITYHVTVNPEDTGKVIGKYGRVAKAVRTIVSTHRDNGRKVFVEID